MKLFGSGVASTAPPDAPSANPIRILLIDDDPTSAELLRWTFQRIAGHPYRLDWVDNAGEAVLRIAERLHDAYLVDHRLGAMLGTDVIAIAREQGSRAPMILLTAHRDPSIDRLALEAGADDFLLKGEVDAEGLDRTLRYSIRQARTVTELADNREELAALERIGELVTAEGPTPSVMSEIVNVIAKVFRIDHLSLYMADDARFLLAAEYGYGESAAEVLERDSGRIGPIVRAGTARFVVNVSVDPDRDRGDAPTSELCIPLIVGMETVGLLLAGSPDSNPIGEAAHAMLLAITHRIELAIELEQERAEIKARSRQLRGLIGLTAAANDVADRSDSGASELLSRIDPVVTAYRHLLVAVGPHGVEVVGDVAQPGRADLDITLADIERAALAAVGLGDVTTTSAGSGFIVTVPIRGRLAKPLLLVLIRPNRVSRLERDGLAVLRDGLAIALRDLPDSATATERPAQLRAAGAVQRWLDQDDRSGARVAVLVSDDAEFEIGGIAGAILSVERDALGMIAVIGGLAEATRTTLQAIPEPRSGVGLGCAMSTENPSDGAGLVSGAVAALAMSRRAGGCVVA